MKSYKEFNLLTFNEWNSLGFRIKKGEKSKERNSEGLPVFSKDQVVFTEHDDSYWDDDNWITDGLPNH